MSNIAINSTPSRVQLIATAAQTVFTINFPFNLSSDLKVYQRIDGSTAVDATDLLTETTEYAILGAGTAAGGTMTLVTGATLNDIITIVGDDPVDRSTVIGDPSKLTNTTLNTNFNNLVIYVKQLETRMNQLMLNYNNNESTDGVTGGGYLVDNIMPLLAGDQLWKKNTGNTAFIAATLPDYPIGSVGGNFADDNRLVRTDTSGGVNEVQQSGIIVDDNDYVTGVARLTVGGVLYPTADGTANQVLQTDGAGTATFSNAGDGDVDGPAGATDNVYARYDGATGKLLQNSLTTETDAGNVTFAGTVTLNAAPTVDLEAATKKYVDDSVNTPLTAAINQVAHGFTGQELLYMDGATYTLAVATSAAAAEVVGIVSAVAGVDDFTLQFGGLVTGLAALTAGDVLYLSESSAGDATSTAPTTPGEIVKPVMLAASATTAYWNQYIGVIV